MENFNELAVFVLVAQEHSFTRAAAKLGVSQSALSQTIRNLEERLSLRLLTRTTRHVSPTEIGEKLLQSLAPRFSEIESELSLLKDLRESPTGTVRISTGEHPAVSYVQPALIKLLHTYPDIHVELTVDYGLTDIVEERFDAGVRLGEQIAKDMIAVRISPDIRMAVVGAPDYFRLNPIPKHPQDLLLHNCINMRLPTYGGLFPWEFSKDGQDMKVRVDGQLVFNNLGLRLNSVLAGNGLSYLPEDQVQQSLQSGALIRVLDDWCPYYSGYHLYYPNRKHLSVAFSLVIDALRYSSRT
jgi:DNA-binding transcriptional LysR family regulator